MRDFCPRKDRSDDRTTEHDDVDNQGRRMSGCSIRARAARGEVGPLRITRDPDVLASVLEDAAHFPGGHAAGLVSPANEAEAAAVLREAAAVLPIGAQSSLTGGATPMGDLVLSTSRLNHVLGSDDDWVRVEAGVTLTELDAVLESIGRYYPPVPTYSGACVGGIVATNAAGAATFKYGTTRDWVEALTIVLPSGDVLDVTRGAVHAGVDGYFELALGSRILRIPVPRYRMPVLPKLSAGYFAAPRMDLIDLFIGAEGTLGVVTDVTLRVLPARPAMCLAFVPFATRSAALDCVRRLRDDAQETWRSGDPRGIDVSSIEHMDARCLSLLREDGVDRANGVAPPAGTAIALLITLELAADMTSEQAFDEIGRARDASAPDTRLVRFCRVLEAFGVLDAVEIAVPGDRKRAAQLLAVREAVPAAVNQRVGRAKQLVDPGIEKTAADMIVPFNRIEELLAYYDAEFERRGLDAAVWGHISDGNVHPNVIPRSIADVESGKRAIAAFGREAIRLGGAPLAEHGVGRNAVKQQLLVDLYGEDGVEDMRRVKRAIDPEWKLAPGVLFQKEV
jgi:D-lactate dehydrogenase (cytochrome)